MLEHPEHPPPPPGYATVCSQNIIGYMDPAIKGSNITISCASVHKWGDFNIVTTTSMGNGKWESDPREAECKSEI